MKTGIKDWKQNTFSFLSTSESEQRQMFTVAKPAWTPTEICPKLTALFEKPAQQFVTSNSIPWVKFAYSQWDLLDLARSQHYIDFCMPLLPPEFEKWWLHVDTGQFSKQVKNCVLLLQVSSSCYNVLIHRNILAHSLCFSSSATC